MPQTKENPPFTPVPLGFVRFLCSRFPCYSESFQTPWRILVAFYTWLVEEGFVWKASQLAQILRIKKTEVESLDLPWNLDLEIGEGPLPTDLEEQIDWALQKYLKETPEVDLKRLTALNPDREKFVPYSSEEKKEHGRKQTSGHRKDFIRAGYDHFNPTGPARSRKISSDRHKVICNHQNTFLSLQSLNRICYLNMIQVPFAGCADRMRIAFANRRKKNNTRLSDVIYVDFGFSSWNTTKTVDWKKRKFFNSLVNSRWDEDKTAYMISFEGCKVDAAFFPEMFGHLLTFCGSSLESLVSIDLRGTVAQKMRSVSEKKLESWHAVLLAANPKKHQILREHWEETCNVFLPTEKQKLISSLRLVKDTFANLEKANPLLFSKCVF